jgi:hypothetical protein
MNFGCRVCQRCVQIGQISVIFDKTAKKNKQWGRLKSAFRKKNFPFLAVAPDG